MKYQIKCNQCYDYLFCDALGNRPLAKSLGFSKEFWVNMPRILLVDDDDLYRAALARLLRPLHEIVEASNGLQAQTAISEQKIDLVISDIRMPKNDGLKLLRWIKETHNLPVILITGYSEALETTSATELGADGFLSKPFKFAEIKILLDKFLPKAT